MPKHGDERHHGLKTEIGLASSMTYSDTETYCGHCKAWIPTPGVTGQLKFMAEHRDGDCQKA